MMGEMLAARDGNGNSNSLLASDMGGDGRSSSSMGAFNTSGPSSASKNSQKRGRSSSILSIHEIKENYDDALDQSAMSNLNADWVNYKGVCVRV